MSDEDIALKRSGVNRGDEEPHKRMKKKGEDEEGEAACQISALQPTRCYAGALAIVLQHWMAPELGWSIKSLDDDGRSLREEIVQHFVNEVDEDDEDEKLRVATEIENKLKESNFSVEQIDFLADYDRLEDVSANVEDYLPQPISVSVFFFSFSIFSCLVV
jgi:hypothetical protein